jgi:hypothetical protein
MFPDISKELVASVFKVEEYARAPSIFSTEEYKMIAFIFRVEG